MMKMIALWVVLVASAGAAFAQTGSGSAAPGGAAAGSGAAPAAGEPQAPPPSSPAAPVPPAASVPSAADARKLCTAAMNADPQFAGEISRIADERAAQQRDRDTVAAHVDADYHIQKNERHVIYAYAAMWIVSALFVIFLWRRQQVLKTEISNLRRDLEAAANDPGAAKDRA